MEYSAFSKHPPFHVLRQTAFPRSVHENVHVLHPLLLGYPQAFEVLHVAADTFGMCRVFCLLLRDASGEVDLVFAFLLVEDEALEAFGDLERVDGAVELPVASALHALEEVHEDRDAPMAARGEHLAGEGLNLPRRHALLRADELGKVAELDGEPEDGGAALEGVGDGVERRGVADVRPLFVFGVGLLVRGVKEFEETLRRFVFLLAR